MEKLLEAIRDTLGDAPTPEQRAAVAEVCRAVLSKLDPSPAAPATPPTLPDPVGQILDAVLAKVKAATVPRRPLSASASAVASTTPVRVPRVPFVPVKKSRRTS